MADVNYVITIKSESEEASTNGITPLPTGQTLSHNAKNDSVRVISKVAAYNYAKQAVDMMISSSINTVNLRTGNSRQQEIYAFNYSIAKQIFGLAEGVVIGAKAGGAIGAVVGATVSVATSLVNLAIAQNQLNLAKSVEQVGINLASIRAGAGGDRIGRVTY